MSIEFQFEMTKNFWREIAVMFGQKCELLKVTELYT